MSAGATIYSILHGSGAVAAIVGTRIYPDVVPQGAAMPAIVYKVIAGRPENVMDGPPPADHELFQIDAWAENTNTENGGDVASALREAARAAFESVATLITAGIGAKVVAFYALPYEPDTRRYGRSFGLSVWSTR